MERKGEQGLGPVWLNPYDLEPVTNLYGRVSQNTLLEFQIQNHLPQIWAPFQAVTESLSRSQDHIHI